MLSSIPPPPADPRATPAASSDVGIIGAERRFQTSFAYYVMALFAIISAEAGTVYGALFVIGCTELVMSLWRPTPRAAYTTTLAPRWEGPVRALRLYLVARQFLSYAWGFVIVTVVAGFFIVVARPRSLGISNLVVVAIFAAYYGSRPLWYGAAQARVGKALRGVNRQYSQGAQVRLAGDGIDILQPIGVINGVRRDLSWHVGFAEIDELRTMGALEAQAYWQSMEMYDPTLGVRAPYELEQFVTGKLARPSIYGGLWTGVHLLVRGPSLLYQIPNADQSGPAAISAWQEWRSHASRGGNLHG